MGKADFYIKYHYDPDKNIIHVYPPEVLSIPDMVSYVDHIINEPGIKEDFIEIVHLDHVKDFKFSYNEALKLPKLFKRFKKEKGYAGSVVLGKGELQFGIARMVSLILDQFFNIPVVRSLEEAEDAVEQMRKK